MYTVTIHYSPQTDEPLALVDTTTEPATRSEVAKVTVAALDIPALMALLYRKPKKQRSDAGKQRAAK